MSCQFCKAPGSASLKTRGDQTFLLLFFLLKDILKDFLLVFVINICSKALNVFFEIVNYFVTLVLKSATWIKFYGLLNNVIVGREVV